MAHSELRTKFLELNYDENRSYCVETVGHRNKRLYSSNEGYPNGQTNSPFIENHPSPGVVTRL